MDLRVLLGTRPGMFIRMDVCMYVLVHVCMYVRTYLCVCAYLCMCECICMYVCTNVCMYVRMYVCMYITTECVLLLSFSLSVHSLFSERKPARTVCRFFFHPGVRSRALPDRISTLFRVNCACLLLYSVGDCPLMRNRRGRGEREGVADSETGCVSEWRVLVVKRKR